MTEPEPKPTIACQGNKSGQSVLLRINIFIQLVIQNSSTDTIPYNLIIYLKVSKIFRKDSKN